MTKRCGSCKQDKPLTDFAKNKSRADGLQGMCRSCKKVADAKHYSGNVQKQLDRNAVLRKSRFDYVSQKKRAPCSDCGKTFIPFAMDFDHVRGQKFRDISAMCNKVFAIEAIDAEIAKCDLVCATCHRIRTYNRRMGL